MSTDSSRTHYRWTFAVLAVSVGAYSLLQSLVVPVLPTIQAGLHTSQNSVTWVLTSYLLSASIFTPIFGRLGDMFGKERFLVISLVGLLLGSVLAAVSGSILLMIVARVIQGIGGGVLPLSFGIIRDEFPSEKVASAVGTMAALVAAGAGLGIVIAGPIVDALDYHWLFWIPAIVLVFATIGAKVVVPESPVRTPGRLSWPAILLLSTWLVALVLAISEAPVWGWGSTSVLGLIVLSIIIGALWIRVESRSKAPLIDMKMMRVPAIWTTNLVALLFGMGLYAIFAFIPEFLQTPSHFGYGFGDSITKSGFTLLPSTATMFIFGLLSGRLSKRYSSKLVLIVGSILSIVPFIILLLWQSREWEILVAMFAEGTGFGLAFSAMSNIVVQSVPPEQTGVAVGMNANIRTIGGAAGAAVMSSLVTSKEVHGYPVLSGYTHGFGMLVVASAFAALATFFVPSVKKVGSIVPKVALPHPEMGLMAGGTLIGDESE